VKILIALLLSIVTVAHAEDGGLLPGLISAPVLLPVSIAGNDVKLDSYVVRPDRPGRFPLVIMLHGTPSEGEAFVSELAKRTPINFNMAAVAFSTWLCDLGHHAPWLWPLRRRLFRAIPNAL
jgi:hypothetical protein